LSRWRLILDGESHGAWNMGVDEALMRSAVRTDRPTLRFYHWKGPWLSLGYGQSVSAERIEACERAGVGWIRRVSGGRAVLHGEDLTYALAARESQLPAGLRASYELVAGALLEALRAIGIQAEASPFACSRPREPFPPRFGNDSGPSTPIRRWGFDCFARAAGREICVDGRKLAGSAQRRAGGGVLQHGSIRLRPDTAEARQASSLSGDQSTSVAELGVDVAPGALQSACVNSFEKALGAEFELVGLTGSERAWAQSRVESHQRAPGFAPAPAFCAPSRQPLGSR
jgi:lipoate-protein ligase A